MKNGCVQDRCNWCNQSAEVVMGALELCFECASRARRLSGGAS